jgi:shikimate dehydrogenase
MTALYGLIGDPLDHSVSPQIHNAAYREMGLDAVYVCLRIRGGVSAALRSASLLGIRGLNVTIPYKSEALSAADTTDDLARRIGAANVLLLGEKVTAFNTDSTAALRSIREVIGSDISGLEVTLVGAGGSARALAFGLAQEGCTVTIINRTLDRASSLSRDVNASHGGTTRPLHLTRENIRQSISSSDLLINATPVGMYPKAQGTIADASMLHEDLVVMDLVYNPKRTTLLKEAEKRGCRTIGGLRMLVYQAAESIRIWFGLEAPVETMVTAAEEALAGYR